MSDLESPPRLTPEQIQGLDLSDLAPGEDIVASDDEVIYEDGFFTSYDGTKLFWQSWSGASEPRRGRIALMHGYGEHSSRYAHVGHALVRAGYDVMAFDARGHGRSDGKDAHVYMYDEYVLDLERLCGVLEERWGEERGPLFVLGHSNGGLIALRYALRRPKHVMGFMISSPMCGFKVKVPVWKEKVGGVMSKVWPTFGLPTELDPKHLTHLESVVKKYADDPLVKTIATARWFDEAKSAQADLKARAAKIDHPLLMLVGGSDEIVDPQAAQDIYYRLGSKSKEIEVYRPLFHEILNEESWGEITRRMITWLEQQREALGVVGAGEQE